MYLSSLGFSFLPASAIRAVDVYVNDTNENKINAFRFYDDNDNMLREYKTEDITPTHIHRKQELEDNEELIGLYGVTDKEDWITSLGFIVKVKTQE